MGDKRLSAEEVSELYERHGPALVVYACGYVVNTACAEDVVHGVFQRLLAGHVGPLEYATGYLYRAVRNAALNARRNGTRDASLDEPCFVHREGNREAALALQRALSELPEEQRAVVVMRIWDGLTLQEAAEATGVPLNTAASRYRYAIEKLRERLQPYELKPREKERDEER